MEVEINGRAVAFQFAEDGDLVATVAAVNSDAIVAFMQGIGFLLMETHTGPTAGVERLHFVYARGV